MRERNKRRESVIKRNRERMKEKIYKVADLFKTKVLKNVFAAN